MGWHGVRSVGPHGVHTGVALVVVASLVAGVACSSDDDEPPTAADTTTTTVRTDPAPDGPNVVFVLLDDLDAMTLPWAEATPRTQARLAEGTTFANAFVTSPECCPSRATALTGDYPHNTGIYDSTPPDGGYATFAAGREEDTLATRLHDAGYHTSFVGKYLNGYEEESPAVPPGWDRWFGLGKGFGTGYGYTVNVDGTHQRYGDDEEDYLTDVLADRVDEEITRAEADDDRPFLLAVWTSAPHDEIPAAPRDADNPYADADLPRGPSFDEADVGDKPTWLREGQRRLTERDVDDLTRRYRMMSGSLYAVDDLIEGIYADLEAAGELDDTIVVVTSDNGYNFGAHRLPHKMAPYEESIRIPMAMTGPGIPAGTTDRMVAMNDITPTLLDAAGLPVDDLDGRPLWPLLDDPDAPWRDDLLVEYHGTYHPLNTVETLDDVRRALPSRRAQGPDERPPAFVPTFRAVRTTDHLYVEWYAGDEHEHELYDLATDPSELTNLLADPASAAAQAATVATLDARLDQLAACDGPTCRDDP